MSLQPRLHPQSLVGAWSEHAHLLAPKFLQGRLVGARPMSVADAREVLKALALASCALVLTILSSREDVNGVNSTLTAARRLKTQHQPA